MMLTISGIPPTTKYKDLRLLIKTRCNLADFILDDLVYDINGLKKVRIGLANASEGAHLIKCLAGYRMEGCPLSVTPVGKTQMPGPGQQQNFNQPQNEYHNNDYNDSRPSPWGQQGNHQNQWTSGPMGQQVPQNTYGYQNQQGPQMQQNQFMPMQQHQNLMPHHNQHLNQQQQMQPEMKQFPQQVPPGRGPQNQGYGFQPKNNVPEPSPAQRSHVLRTVEIVDTPVFSPAPHQNRYPNQGFHSQDKSLTIMKDNFQGPSQYNMGHREPGPQGPTQQPWLQPQQQTHPFDKPNQSFEKPGYSDPKRPPIKEGPNYKSYDKDYDRVSPRRDMRKSPPRKMSPGRRPSPRVSPRRQSPRRQSPGRRSPGRRGSPSHRMEGGRSPGLTMEGPAGRGWRRASPSRSPGRTGSARYSPSRRLDKPDEFSDRGSKAVRPAYEPPTQAQNQAIYSGGYRPNIHNKSAYPTPGSRPMEQRDSPWQQDRDKAMFKETIKKIEDERNVPRLSYERSGGRLDLEQKRSRSPRKSRSPRRDKSPNRDNFKRHSPSPRSPRRSWALEKRRSPDLSEAPPPPIWPGQIKDKGNFEDIEAKRKPVWEYDKKALDPRRPDDERRFPGQDVVRVRRDLGGIHSERREELELNRNDRFPREGHKFSPRDDFDKKVPKFSPRDDFDRKVPKFSPRDDFDRKGPKFSPRDDFDKKGLKFEPRDDFEKKGPKFGPRDDFDKKQPVFGPRDEYDDKRPKFTGVSTKYGEPYQDSKFNRDDSKFSRDDMRKSHDFGGPRFSPRNDFDDRHDDYRKHDVPVRKSWETQTKPPEREVYGGADLPKREDVQRMEVRKNMLRKMSEELDKQFEDVHKRAQDFQKRAEEYRRDDRRRDYDRSEPDPKPCDDRSKHRDDDRRESRFDERRKENWNMINKANIISAAIKAKKEKACDEITQKILDKHNIDAEAEQNARVCQELKIAVSRAIHDMFGDSDVSFIELVVKFNAKYSGAGEDKLLRDVMSSFPIQFRPKRSAPDYGSEVPAKMYRRSPGLDLNKGKRKFSPPRPRPISSEFPVRERNPYPGPAKKPRLESHVPYDAPEKRTYAKPGPRPAAPRVNNPQTTIEMRPVIYNAPTKSVSEFPPLPQRPKPVHKPQPKPTPPAQPVKPVEKQTPISSLQKQVPAKPAEKQMPVMPGQKQMPVMPGQKQMPVNTAVKQVPVQPAVNQVKPAEKQMPVNSAGKQVSVKPAGKQVPVSPAGKPIPVKPAGKQMPVNPAGKAMPVNAAQKPVPVNPAEKQVPVNPAQNQVPVNPSGKPLPVNPAGKPLPGNPAKKQVPVNPAQKQVPVNPAQKQVPEKAAVKQTPVKAAENLEQAKPVQKQPAKPVVQAQEAKTAEKEDALELTVDGNSLNALASRVLVDEIQDIMDKISEELPEEPKLRADKLVVERFRTIIGDDIRNALGLNVTTRILDMHNPLYVKLGFSGKPEAGCLQAFIARYDIGAFKRIAAPGDVFAARLDSVQAFDRLCGEKKLLCGTASVTVTPCYKFLTCPSEVKSIYAVNNEEKVEKTEDKYSNSSDQTLTKSEDTDKNAKNTVDNVARADDQKVIKEADIKIKEEVDDDTLAETRPVTPVKNRKSTPVKVNITIEAATKSDAKKVAPRGIKFEITDEITKDVDNNLKIKKELLGEAENSGIKKVKSENNVNNKTSKGTYNSSVVGKVDEELGDDQELSDRDILAFISGGIVLDECSGSEDEK